METSGTITFTASNGSSLAVTGISDSTEPYSWSPTNSADVLAFGNTLNGLTDRSLTVVFNDNVTPPNSPATGTPTISGTTTQGQTLTVDASPIADTNGLGTFSYQWYRGATTITGATSSTYTLVAADVGSTLTCTVSFTDGDGYAESRTSAATATIAAPPVTPNNPATGTPTISGTTTQGQTLTVSTSSIADSDGLGTFSYQWYRGGSTIAGATSSTYTLVAADVGSTLTCTVSFTDGAGNAESRTSAATATIASSANSPATGTPTISGTTTQGQTLTVSTSSIADSDGLGTFSYQWYRGGTTIAGATSSTYTLVAADVGSTLTCTVSFTDGAGNAESRTSAATATIASSANSPATGTPTISGTTTQGQTLTVDASPIADSDGLGTFSYQWYRGGTTIAGATSSTYTLVAADVGSTLTCTVSFTDGAGNAESRTSAATATIAASTPPPPSMPGNWVNPFTWTIATLSASTVVQRMNEIRDNLRYLKGLDGFVDVESPLSVDGPVRPGVYTTGQRNALTGLGDGDIIYNSTVDEHQGRINGAWVDIRGSTPTGMIVDWNGTVASIPSGFLRCNGANVSRSTYAGLFAVIGTRFGSGDGSTTFGLPNITRSDNRITAVIKT